MPLIEVPGVGQVQFPDDMPDDQIVAAIQRDILPKYGPATGGGSALARGIDEAQGSLYSAAEGAGRVTGIAALERFGREGRVRNEAEAQASLPDSQRMSFEQAQSAGDYGRAGLQALGLSLPSSAAPLAGAAAGAALGSVVPGLGTGLGALAGGFATSIPQFFGANRQRQIQETGEVQSEGRAFLAAVPQAAVESITDRVTLGLGRVLGLGAEEVGRAVIPRIARGIGMGAASEVPTEVLQQALERGQAGLDVLGPDAMKEYKEAAIAAGVLGGTLGGTAAGALGRRPEAPGEDQAKRDAELLAALEALRVPGALEGASEEDLRASARAAMLPNWETATAETLRAQLGRLLDQHNPSPDQTDEQRNTTRNMERDDLAAVRADEVETEERRRLAQRLIGARADGMTLDQLRRVTRAGTDGDLLNTAPSNDGQTDAQRGLTSNMQRDDLAARRADELETEERRRLAGRLIGARADSMTLDQLRKVTRAGTEADLLTTAPSAAGQTDDQRDTVRNQEVYARQAAAAEAEERAALIAAVRGLRGSSISKERLAQLSLEDLRRMVGVGGETSTTPRVAPQTTTAPETPQAEAPQAETPPGDAPVVTPEVSETPLVTATATAKTIETVLPKGSWYINPEGHGPYQVTEISPDTAGNVTIGTHALRDIRRRVGNQRGMIGQTGHQGVRLVDGRVVAANGETPLIQIDEAEANRIADLSPEQQTAEIQRLGNFTPKPFVNPRTAARSAPDHKQPGLGEQDQADQLAEIAAGWRALGNEAMAKVVLAGMKGRVRIPEEVAFLRSRLEEAQRDAKPGPVDPEPFDIGQFFVAGGKGDEQKLRLFGEVASPEAKGLFNEAATAVQAMWHEINRRGYTRERINARRTVPDDIVKLREKQAVLGTLSRMMTGEVALRKGYERADAARVAADMAEVRQHIDALWAAIKASQAAGSAAPSAAPKARPTTIQTVSGMKVDADYQVVDLDSLQHATGRTQPRDRSRASSDAQIADIVRRFNPAQLVEGAEADRGAPIVNNDDVIESGNGRIAALRAIAANRPDQYAAYVKAIQDAGHDTTGIQTPVLVRRRRTELDEDQQRQFVKDANTSSTMTLSTTEQGMMDADLIDGPLLSLLDTEADLFSAANDKFVRAFIGRLSAAERNAMMDGDGMLSQDGARRIEAAILARAYGEPRVLARIMEDTDDNTKSVSKALLRAAPHWIALQEAVKRGEVRPEFDITKALIGAVSMLRDMRSRKLKPSDILDQQDAFSVQDPLVSELFKAFFNDSLTRAIGADRIAGMLERYVAEAQQKTTAQLFADPTTPLDAVVAARKEPQSSLFSTREGGVTATEGTVSADAAKASQVVADRLAALRKMGKQGQAAAAAVEAALASGKFSPQQLLAAFRIAESAARILGNRQLEVRFVPQILHNGIERQGQLAALSPDGTEGLMQFSLSPSSLAFARETGAHEAFHVAQALFAASDPKLLAALKAAFPEGGGLKGIDATLIRKLQTLRPRDSRRSYWDQLAADPAIRDEASSIELQAYVFGALDDAKRNGQSLVGVKPALLRLANFLAELRQRLGAALKGDGFRSVGDVLSGVSGGTKLAGLSRAADIGQPFSSRGSPWASPTTSVPGQARPSTSSGASRTPTPGWSGTAPSPSSPEAASSTSPTTSSAAPAPGRSSSRTTGGLPLFDNQTRLDFGRQGFDPNAIKQIGGIEARVVGPISEGFFRSAEGAMLTLPFKVRQTLRDAGIKVTLGQKFADWNPVMAQQRPRGWMVGSTWAESEGAFDYDTQEILAFETRYDRGLDQQVVTTRPAGLIRHEAGHAFDHAEGLPSAFDQAFHRAWATDLARLPPAFRMADPYHNPLWYYVANSAGQLASRSESFAELMATAAASGRAGPNDTGPLGGSPNVNLADHMPLSANVLRNMTRDSTQKTDGRGQGLLFSSRTLAEPLKQEFSSADTSVKQLAATFRGVDWQPGTRNFDLGGGKYDLGTDYLRERGVENLVYDPFNRSDAHNERVLAATAETAADTATVNNVLNVIKEPEVRSGVIKMAAQSVKDDGTAYFLIYEGDRKGAGKQTSKGWQNNMPAAQYLDEVRAHFDDVTRKGNMIVARDPSLGTRLFSSRGPFEDMAGEPKKRDLDLETPTEHEKLVRGMVSYWEDRAARFELEGRTAEAAHAREQAEKTRQELARLEASDHRRFSREQERLRTMDPHDRTVMWAVEILEKQYGAPADVQQAEKWIARLQRNLPRQEERADAPDADEHTRARADATRIMLARLRKAAAALRRADEGDFTPLFSSRSRPADLANDAAISKAYDATKGPGATPPRWYTKAMMGITGALPGESYKDAIYRNSINRAAPLYILDEMKKAQGVPDNRALGRMADRAFNATGRLEMVLEHGFIGYDPKSDRTFVRSDTPSVLGAFVGPDAKKPRVREAETDDFQNYLAMLRERDLLKSGRSGFKKLKPADVHAAIAAMESKRPAWKDAAADLHKINKAALEFGVATGILDPVKAKELAAIFYTPFYRQAEAEALSETAQGTTGPVTSSSLNNPHAFEKTVHESDSPIGNLFENLVKNYDFILRSGEKNVVLRATAEGMEKITNAAGQKLAERINYRRPGDKQVINLKIGGQSVMFKLNPDDKTAAATFLALVGMPTPVRGALFNAAASLAGVFRTGVTSLPSYMMANLWRGKIVAYAQEGLPFHTNTLQGMKQVYQASTSLKDFAAETGFGGFTFGMGDKNVQAALSRKLRTEGGDATLWDRMSNLVAHLQKLSESTELADRLKLQERLIAQGKSVGEAAHQAYLLAPYSRKGLGGGLVGGTLMALTPLVPFLNSKVQGVARMFEDDNQKRRIAGVPADIFLRGLMLSAFSLGAYALASQEPEWEDETPDRKLMYDIFYTPAGRIYLPRPFEFGTFFGALPVFMLDALRSQQGAQDLHKGAIQALLSTFGFNPIPQAVQPLLEVAFNYDSFRMRPLESQGMEQLPVAERKTEQTSTVAKVLSRGISAVDEAVMPQGSRLEISPVKAQRLIEGYTGSIGTMMLAAIDGLLGAVGAIPEKPGGVFGSPSSPTGMAATVAGVGRFFRADEEFTSRFVGDFYTAKRTADQIHKSFTEALLTGDRDRAQRIVADNRPALAARPMMESVERQMSLLSQQMRAVAERDDMTQDQRREVLARYRQMRNDLSKRAVQAAQAVQ